MIVDEVEMDEWVSSRSLGVYLTSKSSPSSMPMSRRWTLMGKGRMRRRNGGGRRVLGSTRWKGFEDVVWVNARSMPRLTMVNEGDKVEAEVKIDDGRVRPGRS